METTGHVAVIGGVLVAGFEYFRHDGERKEQIAIEHLKEFQRPDLATAKIELQNYWLGQPLDEIIGKKGSAGVLDTLAMSLVFPSNAPPRASELLRVAEQLDVIGACVLSNICDKTVIVDQLGPYIRNFHCLYHAPLETLRTKYLLEGLGKSSMSILDGEYLCK